MHTLVVGTGRCGTGYIARVLGGLKAGVIGHETVFGLGGEPHAREWLDRFDVDCSWLAVPFLGQPWLDGVRIVQLVRRPYNVIRSFLRMGFWTMPQYARYRAFCRKYVPELEQAGSDLERSALWWLRWNERIEPHADTLHRVESDVRGLLDWMGVEHEGRALFGNRAYNSRIVFDCEPDLTALPPKLQMELRAVGEWYGYGTGGLL